MFFSALPKLLKVMSIKLSNCRASDEPKKLHYSLKFNLQIFSGQFSKQMSLKNKQITVEMSKQKSTQITKNTFKSFSALNCRCSE